MPAKCKNTKQQNNNYNKCKIKEITITCFINSLCKFNKTLHRTQNIFTRGKLFSLLCSHFFAKLFLFQNSGPVTFPHAAIFLKIYYLQQKHGGTKFLESYIACNFSNELQFFVHLCYRAPLSQNIFQQMLLFLFVHFPWKIYKINFLTYIC